MKNQSNLSKLMAYAGKHRVLTYLSWVLSVISALVALVPFWYIWCIIRDVLAVAPPFCTGGKHCTLRLGCRIVCRNFYCCIHWRTDVLSLKCVPCGLQYPESPYAAYCFFAAWGNRKIRKRKPSKNCQYFQRSNGELSGSQAARQSGCYCHSGRAACFVACF